MPGVKRLPEAPRDATLSIDHQHMPGRSDPFDDDSPPGEDNAGQDWDNVDPLMVFDYAGAED